MNTEDGEVVEEVVVEVVVVVERREERGRDPRRRIFWIWGSIWIRRLRLSLLVEGKVCSFSFPMQREKVEDARAGGGEGSKSGGNEEGRRLMFGTQLRAR